MAPLAEAFVLAAPAAPVLPATRLASKPGRAVQAAHERGGCLSLVAPGTVLMAGAVAKRRKSRRHSQLASSSSRAEKTVSARAAVVMR
ncbi:hypothetical protein AK812_SmicGene24894, partial [Symbiodinium microadriaticum]